MTAALWGFVGLGATYLLWVLYLAVMNLKRARDMGLLTKPAHALGIPLLFTGLLLDFLVNVFVMTVILLELPRETLVTTRLKRHNKGTGWRQKVAAWFEQFLDPFDPDGDHI